LYCGYEVHGKYAVVLWQSEPLTESSVYSMELRIEQYAPEAFHCSEAFYLESQALSREPVSRQQYNELLIAAANSKMIMSKRLMGGVRQYVQGESAWSTYLKVSGLCGTKQVYNKPMKDKLQMLYEWYTNHLTAALVRTKSPTTAEIVT
jgi:hypothetical protein